MRGQQSGAQAAVLRRPAALLDEPLPVDGWVELDPTKPGFGVTLNRDLLRRPYEHAPQPSPPTAPAKSHADWLADPVTAILEAAPRA